MTQRPAPSEGSSAGATTPSSHTSESGDLRHALLASLGLPADATPEAIDHAHDRVAGYLAAAPQELSGWAHQQATAADAAHAVLTGKAGDVLSRRTAATRPVATGAAQKPLSQRILTNPLVLVALIAAIVVGVYKWGGSSAPAPKPPVAMGQQDTGQSGAMPAPSKTPVDAAKVKELEAKIDKNPKDVQSMAVLGDMYFGAEDYAKSAMWRDRIVQVAPKNTDALLASGVAYFNGRDNKTAEARWNKALEIDPKKAEAYYDLGFLALSKNPPDTAKAQQLWDKVVELDPNGPMAQKVQNHMGAIMTPAPTAPASTPAPTSSK